jgi:hypothetical protein
MRFFVREAARFAGARGEARKFAYEAIQNGSAMSAKVQKWRSSIMQFGDFGEEGCQVRLNHSGQLDKRAGRLRIGLPLARNRWRPLNAYELA